VLADAALATRRFFRETAHYRHFWVLLPLAFVAAEQAGRARPVQEVVLT
jgi:hypothetical protein